MDTMRARQSMLTICVVAAVVAAALPAGAVDTASPPPPAPPERLFPPPAFTEHDTPEAVVVNRMLPLERAAAPVDAGLPSIVNLRDLITSEAPVDSGVTLSHVQGRILPEEDSGPTGGGSSQEPSSLPVEDPVPMGERAAGDQVFEFSGLAETGWIPPDTQAVAGPSHVLVATNSGFAVYSKLGDEKQGYTSYSSFFDSQKPAGWQGFLFDPKLLYSREFNRYVMLVVGRDDTNQTAHFFFAISQTTDPLGNWWRWRYDRTNTGGQTDAWLDYCTIGSDTWGLYVTGNMFYWTGGFKWSILQIINPTAFTGGSSAGWIWHDLEWPSGSNAFTVQPAHAQNVNSNQETFLLNTYSGSGSSVLLWKLDGTRASTTVSPNLSRAEITGVTAYDWIGENVDQPDTSYDLDGGNARIWNAVYHNRRAIGVFTNDVDANAGRSAVHTVSVNTDTNALDWQHVLAPSVGNYYYYPAITTYGASANATEAAVFYSYSTASIYASAGVKYYTAFGTGSDGPNYLYHSGTAGYVDLDDDGVNRWGDYSGAAYDFSCNHAWGAAEYASGTSTWGTRLTAVTMGAQPECPILDMRNPDGGETLIAGRSTTVTWARDNLATASDLWVLFDADNNGTWEDTIAGPISTTTTSQSWTIPNDGTTTGRVFVGRWNGSAWTVGDWTDRFFTVDGCPVDAYEADNSLVTARPITSGIDQVHSICAAGDTDWVRFVLASPSAVTLETSGPSGDTRMWLQSSAGTVIEYDDDDGAGNFSFIDRTCGVDALAAGTYYVEVDEYGGNDHIDSYTLSFDAVTCPQTVIFANGFETGNFSGWSSHQP